MSHIGVRGTGSCLQARTKMEFGADIRTLGTTFECSTFAARVEFPAMAT